MPPTSETQESVGVALPLPRRTARVSRRAACRCRLPTLGLAAALASGPACAPEPELDASVVRDLRVLAVATAQSGTPLPLGPPDGARPLYTFAAAPPPAEVRVLVVDPTAPGAPVRLFVAACPAIFGPCEAGAETTIPVVVGAPARPEVVTFTFAPSADDLNRWLAADPWAGFDRLSVRLDVEVEGARRARARAFAVLAYYGDEIVLDQETGWREARTAETSPTSLAASAEGAAAADGGESSPLVDLLAGGRLSLAPGERLRLTIADDSVYARIRYLLPEAPGAAIERVVDSEADFVRLHAVGGRIGAAETLALTGAWLDYRAPAAVADFPDSLYVVVADGGGGVAFARWTIENRAASAPGR